MRPLLACGVVFAAMLAGTPPAVACAQWNAQGIYKISQSNGFTVSFTLYQEGGHISGRARYPGAVGDVSGDIAGESFRLMVEWNKTSRGQYSGFVDANGWVLGGKTYDAKNPASSATWSAYAPLTCAVP